MSVARLSPVRHSSPSSTSSASHQAHTHTRPLCCVHTPPQVYVRSLVFQRQHATSALSRLQCLAHRCVACASSVSARCCPFVCSLCVIPHCSALKCWRGHGVDITLALAVLASRLQMKAVSEERHHTDGDDDTPTQLAALPQSPPPRCPRDDHLSSPLGGCPAHVHAHVSSRHASESPPILSSSPALEGDRVVSAFSPPLNRSPASHMRPPDVRVGESGGFVRSAAGKCPFSDHCWQHKTTYVV
jgi:hypothetical protein